MAVSTHVQQSGNHRQLLYAVSTRLSKENIKDMIYLAGIEQRLQESVSSGIDFFTILEQRGLLGEHNYTHLISFLETIGRIDLTKLICSDHQAPAVTTLHAPDKLFSVAEQLAIMKRAQILQKKELYVRSMQKLELLYNSKTIQQQISDTFFLQILSLLQIPEADLDHTSLQPLTESLAHSLLSSVSLFCTSAINMLKLFLVGESREVESLTLLCLQRWNQFCAKVPKNYTPLVGSLQQARSIITDDLGDKLIWQTAKETHQSLKEVFSELLGSQDLLTAADTSFNEHVISGESYHVIIIHLLTISKWLIQLSQAIQCGYINIESQQDIALVLASTYREGIADNADQIVNILGLDSLEEILELIPKMNKTFTKFSSEDNSQALLAEMNKSMPGLLCSTCLALLVQATMSAAKPHTQVKSVLPALRKAVVAYKGTKSYCCTYVTKKLVSNVQREARMYRNKCQQVIETVVGKSSQSADILRSLFEDC